jgi:predicted O-linked N-acetylglucosamine transferase (SPINDLY family)
MAGNPDGAIPLYAEAISRGSNSPEVFNDLGTLLARRGQFPPAVVQFEMALALAPHAVDVRKNLSMALEAMSLQAVKEDRWVDAAAGYGRLTNLDPTCVTFQTNAGLALYKLKLLDQALPYFRRVVELEPGNPTSHVNLGSVLFDLNRREAEVVLERALELDPKNVLAHVNLSAVHNRLGQLARSAETVRRALELAPDQVEAHANLAGVFREQGEVQASLEHYRRALEIRPDHAVIFSGYLLARQGDPTADPADLLADHLAWAARFATPLDPGPAGRFGTPDRDPARRLRIGYVSGDFRSHSVASFIEPIIRAHDRNAVEVTCYSNSVADHVTLRIQNEARPDAWREIRNLTDELLVKRIVADKIDVLIDLSGHTDANRLLCFARRPAPVQVTYCGYPSTTGLSAIGWRLTDAMADPESEGDQYNAEHLWRLPNGFLCYQPNADCDLPGPAPALTRGHVTFGSFNNLSKLGDGVLELWAEILRAVPGSHLLLKARALSDQQPRERLRLAFAQRGIAVERIEFAPYAATPAAHVATYGQVDVALDPFPYNGTTTTCEALWMGVPVITLRGHGHAGRVGASLLTRIGCPDLVAATPEEYVQSAVRLSRDLDGLSTLRAGMRARMASSALMNASVIAHDIETAYREMWRRFCAQPLT